MVDTVGYTYDICSGLDLSFSLGPMTSFVPKNHRSRLWPVHNFETHDKIENLNYEFCLTALGRV